MTRYTYQHLLELVDGDDELIARLVEEGEIVRRDEGDIVTVDVERVLVAHTLLRELDVDWNGVEVILRLREELVAARRRIAELESPGDDVSK
ncbi:MAG: hypothetical protein ABJE66_10455 [Deltaproteobacteria bacterium]